ncbi:MAG: Fic family protein, partial [Chitinophagaceae bacterium]|nr:Fic family protein [Chitinophagaceae bacterium]
DMTEAARWLAFERWMIDLSWKSAQIVGNTYTLLETELLLKEQKTAKGKTQEEATMLLNHKTAIDFILANPGYLQPLTRSAVEDVHSILMKDLAVEKNIRTKPVAITGTNYKPLDNIFQIKEALELLCVVANKKTNMFERAFLLLLMVSYIQPFQDGNKRTARILSNAVLLKAGSCPLSFRTVDPLDYKKALLIFYEQQNISAFKKMWMEQFAFAIETYSV